LLGYQVCIDLFECDAAALDTPAEIEAAVRALAAGIGASVVAVSTHRFAPQGLSCIAQISASHIAIHTWPENGFAAVDVFSCTTRVDAEALAGILRTAFGARQQSCTEVPRGAGLRSPFFHDAQA
jgi:S-adenosylmethionine decarboxylase proenzyme